MIKVLVELGADFKAQGEYGGTAMHAAAHDNKLPAVKALMELGADINARDRYGMTALHHAGIRKQATPRIDISLRPISDRIV